MMEDLQLINWNSSSFCRWQNTGTGCPEAVDSLVIFIIHMCIGLGTVLWWPCWSWGWTQKSLPTSAILRFCRNKQSIFEFLFFVPAEILDCNIQVIVAWAWTIIIYKIHNIFFILILSLHKYMYLNIVYSQDNFKRCCLEKNENNR